MSGLDLRPDQFRTFRTVGLHTHSRTISGRPPNYPISDDLFVSFGSPNLLIGVGFEPALTFKTHLRNVDFIDISTFHLSFKKKNSALCLCIMF